MALTPQDINLQNFLDKFTFELDPNPGTKIKLDWNTFLMVASTLKLAQTISATGRFLR